MTWHSNWYAVVGAAGGSGGLRDLAGRDPLSRNSSRKALSITTHNNRNLGSQTSANPQVKPKTTDWACAPCLESWTPGFGALSTGGLSATNASQTFRPRRLSDWC
jgi:hypothetical protein